jgi:outer membrane receptor protein involved in Fe transport
VVRRPVIAVALVAVVAAAAAGQQVGSIRGQVTDQDLDVPLAGAQVLIVEADRTTTTGGQGDFVFGRVPPGRYTLAFTKEGYARQVKDNVVVAAGQMTEVDAALSGEFVQMKEFVVERVRIGVPTEKELLEIRERAPQLMDLVSVDLISKAGIGDVAGALPLVSGVSVQEGKYAVIRGLPDRYVSSQMNGVRLPTADIEKRAVQLDQFPIGVVESIRVSKTFTPDQQGDASGGAVDVVLRGIPEKPMLKFKVGTSYHSQATGEERFLTSRGGGVNCLGRDDGGRGLQAEFYEAGGGDGKYPGAVGVSRDDAPRNYDWSLTAGGKHVFGSGVKVGALASAYYKHKSKFSDEGRDDSCWILSPGDPMTPAKFVVVDSDDDYKTGLFDVMQGSEEVMWGALGTAGVEFAGQELKLAYLHTHDAEDVATLAEDTRGKQAYFPGYDPCDFNSPGWDKPLGAPWLRNETLTYTERTTDTLQLSGRHELPLPELRAGDFFSVLYPEVDWTVACSYAGLSEPDKRRFGTFWLPGLEIGGFVFPSTHVASKDAANFFLGNLQRTWKDLSEQSRQHFVNVKFPFEQWSGDEGYVKLGCFQDRVHRAYDQESVSNFDDSHTQSEGEWEDLWSARWNGQVHRLTDGNIDVDYEGDQEIAAWYYMVDFPLCSWLRIIGGARYEETVLSIVNDPEPFVTWVPPGAVDRVILRPGDADVEFEQKDVLPSIGFQFKPIKDVTLRGSYSRTVARQTFKEMTPIEQQEYLGGPIFIGNPNLKMSALKNYDVRLDWAPHEGALLSASYFYKKVKDPIEYYQRSIGFTFTTPTNYPRGSLSGLELEVRQPLGLIWKPLEGLSVGGNATFIRSDVLLPPEEREVLAELGAPMKSRPMTNAPEHLYNLHLTYDVERLGLTLGVFYTVRGDTLISGAGRGGGLFVPSVYETEYDTLNVTVSKKLGEHCTLSFAAKNLTDPRIQTVYRSEYIGKDVNKRSYHKGMEFSMSFSVEF